MKAIKLPVEVEVMQFTNENVDKVLEWGRGKIILNESTKVFEDYLIIWTLEGNMKAKHGDYIIKGVQGEFYPCKPDIFHKTYDIIRED